MPRIPSANPDFERLDSPSTQVQYAHGMDKNPRRSFIPMAFQITSPFNSRKAMLPHALVMHVNPSSFSQTHNKRVERFQTRGGFVEQHWGDEMTDIQAEGSTGAFMNIYTGLSSVLRQKTIAWDRYRDLHDLYRCNGSVFGPQGNIVLQGRVMLMFDRGTYLGHFTNFEVEEADDKPFSFQVSWSFKVEEELLVIPGSTPGQISARAQTIADAAIADVRSGLSDLNLQGLSNPPTALAGSVAQSGGQV